MRTTYLIALLWVALPLFTYAQPLAGVVNLINRNSNLCLAANSGGENVVQWNCDGDLDKAWDLVFVGGSTYKIMNRKTRLFLGLKNPTLYNGERVTQRADQPNNPLELNWLVLNAGNGYYKIQNLYSGLFLAVEGASLEPGRSLMQWADQRQADILWRITPVNLPAEPGWVNRSGQAVMLPTRSIYFPGGGWKNNNQYIGDFCCTGETAPILDNSNACVGYVYFFNSKSPLYNSANGTLMSDLELLLSGSREFGNPNAPREKGSVYFRPNQVYLGAQMTATVGRILYTVKITDVKFEVLNGYNTGRFYSNSVKVMVTAQAAY